MSRGRLALLGLGAGLLFLWLPVLLLAGYAFSDARIPFQWGGFSLRWFAALAGNDRLVEAALLSLRVALGAASLAVLLGGAIGWVLARHGPFRGRAIFGALAGAPLVLPDVVMGLALLLFFVALQRLTGWPAERGAMTILLAHATIGAAYVAVLVQARLAGLAPELEEAARDLGAGPATAFLTVTLPLLAPGLVAGWLLAFTLSLDDVVVASFVSGPAGTTLPMVVFSMLRLGLTPEVNALAVIILALAGLGGALAALALRGLRRG
ncbi:ABC transporter permease [Teichococcus cervicalis]|uniref:ABC transporter, permease protein n=1 Tax=Pseudoroseomonas cervicalis ATCC 49957 TaxID=525371 RepID=D5RIL7_9PROT|nr:ABC transporter permease subunit [Pseudoroseomonas cervicalis]EFH12846.1 ABC transporter, permease protein [Pseudoroseomonas cervicalis ATCC 49957]WBV44650.1 ABC transporter permease subunit [Pseudoroseomonas cervicalis]